RPRPCRACRRWSRSAVRPVDDRSGAAGRVQGGCRVRSRNEPGCRRVGIAGWWASDRMTEANEQEQTEQEQKRPLTLRSGGGTLGLRRPVETGQVRQSFSHGRSKQVTVEVRKKRVIGPGSAPEPAG